MRPEALIFGYSQLLKGWTVMDRLSEIKVPTLVMAGRYDFLFPPEHQVALAAGIPNAHLEIIERAGHNPHMERPAEVLGQSETLWLPQMYLKAEFIFQPLKEGINHENQQYPLRKDFRLRNLPMRKKAKPNPILEARLWRWHTGWCPAGKLTRHTWLKKPNHKKEAEMSQTTQTPSVPPVVTQAMKLVLRSPVHGMVRQNRPVDHLHRAQEREDLHDPGRLLSRRRSGDHLYPCRLVEKPAQRRAGHLRIRGRELRDWQNRSPRISEPSPPG